MAVVSVSLPAPLLTDADRLIAEGRYQGRSELVRTAMRHLLQDRHTIGAGHVHGSVTLLYGEGHEARVSEVRHAFHDVVLSMMHTHCEPEVCMDVLVVGGPARRIQELQETLERLRFVDRAVLVPFTITPRPAGEEPPAPHGHG